MILLLHVYVSAGPAHFVSHYVSVDVLFELTWCQRVILVQCLTHRFHIRRGGGHWHRVGRHLMMFVQRLLSVLVRRPVRFYMLCRVLLTERCAVIVVILAPHMICMLCLQVLARTLMP